MNTGGSGPADGLVWIENGKFQVKDPAAGGRPAVIIPTPEIRVLVNGKPIEQITTVSAADEIKGETRQETVPPFSIAVTPDKMTASLLLDSRAFSRRVLEDTPPQNQLAPRSREERMSEAAGASLPDVIRELNRKGVTFGIDYEAIREALAKCICDTPVTVAKGEAPVPGTDARMEYHVEREITYTQAAPTDEKVDYRDVIRIPSVNPGQLLATKYPQQPGQNGTAVTGEIVPPLPPKDIFLVTKRGATEVAEEGVTRVYAAIPGRPVVEETGKFKIAVGVQEKFIHSGDVGLATGNINFNGDVEITGNVTETMTVNAGGSVAVFGNIAGATVNAGGSIAVRGGTIQSTLLSGGVQAVYAHLQPAAESLLESIRLLTAAVGQILARTSGQARAERQLGRLIYVLLTAKFSNITELTEKIEKEIVTCGHEIAAEVTEPIRAAGNLFKGSNPLRISKIETINPVLQGLAEATAFLATASSNPAVVSLGYSINTEIVTSGDVLIGRQGGYNTVVNAAGRVKVNGIFRGGEINAGGDVTVEEAGSAVGVLTKIRTANGKSITIAHVYDNTVVQIGKLLHKFETEQRYVRVRLNPQTGLLEMS